MSPYYSEQGVTLYNGDVRDVLRQLPDGAFNTCVTSPPYFGLRDYGTAQWEGGDEGCDHYPQSRQGPNSQRAGRTFTAIKPYRDQCGKCGATRIDCQLGLESTPEEYVANMVEVFREVRRCLRDDGTLWLNIGDSYNGIGGPGKQDGGPIGPTAATAIEKTNGRRIAGLKQKDLIGIPWMLAFALRADGWYLRSDIIWHKPNPMPESVTDRPTKSHEYIFLLSKSDRYYYDADAIMERGADSSIARLSQNIANQIGSTRANGGAKTNGNMKAVCQHKQAALGRSLDSSALGSNDEPLWRNRRSVWTITTKPYAGAHFATFPEDLIRPCVLAGAPDGGHVLEPFNGSGTTLKVARDLGRRATGIELNPKYCGLAVNRLSQMVMFPAEVPA